MNPYIRTTLLTVAVFLALTWAVTATVTILEYREGLWGLEEQAKGIASSVVFYLNKNLRDNAQKLSKIENLMGVAVVRSTDGKPVWQWSRTKGKTYDWQGLYLKAVNSKGGTLPYVGRLDGERFLGVFIPENMEHAGMALVNGSSFVRNNLRMKEIILWATIGAIILGLVLSGVILAPIKGYLGGFQRAMEVLRSGELEKAEEIARERVGFIQEFLALSLAFSILREEVENRVRGGFQQILKGKIDKDIRELFFSRDTSELVERGRWYLGSVPMDKVPDHVFGGLVEDVQGIVWIGGRLSVDRPAIGPDKKDRWRLLARGRFLLEQLPGLIQQGAVQPVELMGLGIRELVILWEQSGGELKLCHYQDHKGERVLNPIGPIFIVRWSDSGLDVLEHDHQGRAYSGFHDNKWIKRLPDISRTFCRLRGDGDSGILLYGIRSDIPYGESDLDVPERG